MASEHRKLAINTLLIGLSKAGGLLSLFILLPIMTRELDSSEYGAIDLIVSYGWLVVPVMLLALEQAAFRYLIDARKVHDEQKKIISTALFTFLPAIALIVVLYILLALVFRFSLFIELLCFMLALSFSTFTSYVLRGFGKNAEYAISSVVQNGLMVAGGATALLVFDVGISGILIAYSAAYFIAGIYNTLSAGIHKRVSISCFDRTLRKEMLKYSLPSIPNSISWWILQISDRSVIVFAIDVSANGIYAVSSKFSSILSQAMGVFGLAWQESATLSHGLDSKKRDVFYSDIFNKQIAIFGALSLLLLCTTGIIFPILVDHSFKEGYLYIPVMILGALLSVVVNFYSGIYLARKETKKTAIMSAWTAGTNLAVSLSLVWFIGIWAAAISTVVAYGAMAVYRHYDMKKYLSITYEQAIFLKIFGSFTIVSTIYYVAYFIPELYWVNFINLLIAAGIGYAMNRTLVTRLVKYGWSTILKKT